MKAYDVKRLKELERENGRLKAIVADQLEATIARAVREHNGCRHSCYAGRGVRTARA